MPAPPTTAGAGDPDALEQLVSHVGAARYREHDGTMTLADDGDQFDYNSFLNREWNFLGHLA